jgi:NADPH:quinone reductase-like Zn-dependent oxidoreductase
LWWTALKATATGGDERAARIGPTVRAVKALMIHRYGGPDVMQLEERPDPEVGPRDVLIDVRAASLNPIDFKLRQGALRLVRPRLRLPIGLGCDVAGVVRAVGAAVTRVRAGDEVFARLEKGRMGGLAERVAADEGVVAKKPAAAGFAEAAALPLAGLTALQSLREAAGLGAGQRVLIHAGAGGVGSLAIQLAKILGLHVATTTSGKNVDFVRGLGADDVVDYTRDDAGERLRGLAPLDAVLDTLGGASEIASLGLVKRGGVVVGIGGRPDGAFARASLPAPVRPFLWLANAGRRRAEARAGARFVYLFMRPDGAELAELAAWVDAGRLRPVVHRSYPFAEVREAFAELERGRARGKIVVTM